MSDSKIMCPMRNALLRERIKDMKKDFDFSEWKSKIHVVRDWGYQNGYSSQDVNEQLKLAGL